MDIAFDIPSKTTLALDDVDAILMVCSHERSGTHFLMNSLASCTRYVSNPFLNYDYMPFGGALNFFSEASAVGFFDRISRFEVNGVENLGMASIVKSHFPLSLVEAALHRGLKAAYIYRSPVDTLISFWKLIHSIDWFEGPKLGSPLELAQHVPCGQSQRYQLQNCASYFDRWALHVCNAVNVARHSGQVALISYESLVEDHAGSIESLAGRLGLSLLGPPVCPSRDKNVIHGADMAVCDRDEQDLKDFCRERAALYPDLPADILRQL